MIFLLYRTIFFQVLLLSLDIHKIMNYSYLYGKKKKFSLYCGIVYFLNVF